MRELHRIRIKRTNTVTIVHGVNNGSWVSGDRRRQKYTPLTVKRFAGPKIDFRSGGTSPTCAQPTAQRTGPDGLKRITTVPRRELQTCKHWQTSLNRKPAIRATLAARGVITCREFSLCETLSGWPSSWQCAPNVRVLDFLTVVRSPTGWTGRTGCAGAVPALTGRLR
jgi:hypothetical protein